MIGMPGMSGGTGVGTNIRQSQTADQGQAQQQGTAPQQAGQAQQQGTAPQQAGQQGTAPQQAGQQPQSAPQTPVFMGPDSMAGGQTQAGRQAQSGGQNGQATPQQTFMRATLPQGFKANPGQQMWGQVTGGKGNFYTMQFGKFTLTAQTRMPMTPGQRVLVAFTDQGKGGQVGLQLLKTMSFSKVSQADLAQTLTKMNIPVNEKSMDIAKGLVEFRIPLTEGNLRDFTKLMSSLPRPMTPADMAAGSFLKMANLPMTPRNVILLANFIAQHPMLGEQLFDLKDEHGLTSRKTDNDREIMLVEGLKSTIGKYTVDPREQGRKGMAQNLHNLAQEEGIEKLEYNGFGGSKMEDGWELMKVLRELEQIPAEKMSGAGLATKQLVEDVRRNLQAHQLINQGRPPESDLAFYHLQVPLRMGNEETTVEIRIKYREEDENRVVDPENTHIEFDVCTEYLGDLHVDLMVTKGLVDVEIGSMHDHYDGFIEKFLPALRKNIENLGYTTGVFKAGMTEGGWRSSLIKKEDFEMMEKIDVHA